MNQYKSYVTIYQNTASYGANILAAAAAAHAAQNAAAISSQKSSSRLLDCKRDLSMVETDNDESIVDDKSLVVESSTMDCLQCQIATPKNNKSECKREDYSNLSHPEGCSVHNTNISDISVRNSLDTKQPPALKFSVNAILARAAQAGSSSSSQLAPDNDSLSEDTDHLGSEGTGASSDHDIIQHQPSRIISQDYKNQNLKNPSSPIPPATFSTSEGMAIPSVISSHPYILGPSLTSVMSGAGGSLAKPVPRPLGTTPLFNGGTSTLQSLLYRHPYLSAAGM